ncbi:eryA [Symbiodinium microadriaticum]|nr:eryA [Symbiodinium microadriaticum]
MRVPARKTAVGLDLGRRLLVVLKSTSKPSEKAQAIRVVDHGEQQKEALRRLYDAQVLLQSYEDQLHAKDEQLYKIQVCVKKAIRESSADYLREPDLIESLGFSEEELHAEGIATEQKPTGKMARFEAMLDQSFENQKWEEKQDRERRAKDRQADGSSLPVLDPQSDMQWFKVPYWIKADEETREMVQKIKQHFMDEMNAKGHFDHNAFLEHLWQCGFQVAQHWAGSPNEELVKQVEAAEKKARSVQREALQETSMLRQHIKRVERKYKELQSNAGKMQKAMSTMASQLKEARDTAAMFGVELPSSPGDTSNRRPSVQRDIPEGFEWWYSDTVSYRGPRRNLPPEPSPGQEGSEWQCHDPAYAGLTRQVTPDPEPSQPRRSRASVRDRDPPSDSDDDPPQNIIDQPPEYPRGRSPRSQASPQSKESFLHGTGAGASYAPLLPEDLGMPPGACRSQEEAERERAERYKDLDIDELELLRGNLQANVSEDLLVRFLRGCAEELPAAQGQLAPVQPGEAPGEAKSTPGLPATSLPCLGPGLPKSGLPEESYGGQDPYTTWQYPRCSYMPSTLWAGTVTAYRRPEEAAELEFAQGAVPVPEEAEAKQQPELPLPPSPGSPSASLERVHSDMTALTEALQARQRRCQFTSSRSAAVSLKFTEFTAPTTAAWVQKPWSKAPSPSPNRLQITVSHAIGNTTEAFLSCEVAGQRRQVSLDQLLEVGPAQAAQALRLPAVTTSMELTLLSRLGHAALVLHPGVAGYSLELETPSPSKRRRLDLQVSPVSGLYDPAGVVERHKRYLEKLIQAALSARPAEPFEFMARQVRNLRLQDRAQGGCVGPCDLRVLGAEGLPPETLLTVRCGHGESRQAQLSHLLDGRKRLKIPDGPLLQAQGKRPRKLRLSSLECSLLFQVTFLLPESAAHLPTSLGLQEVHFPRQGEILGLRVRVAAAEGASPQLSSRMQSASAEQYLCQHRLLPFAQGLLQHLVKAPGSFLVDLEARLRAKARGSQEASASSEL